MRYVIALGGNALLERNDAPDAAVQRRHVHAAANGLASVAAAHEVVFAHGNGPQVGMLALESAADPALSAPFPIDVLGAQTQGMIGYWLVQEIVNTGFGVRCGALLTQTVINEFDPAFGKPTKFVGASYPMAAARALADKHGWQMAADTAGWRRVVASPPPLEIVELDVIKQLVGAGVTVVCAGGGGIPVVRDQAGLRGVEAVVDKDLTAALLAQQLNADQLILLTDVPAIMSGFATADQRPLHHVSVEHLRSMIFPAGSMKPKVDACLEFVSNTGRPAVIGALSEIEDVLAGKSGTTVRV